MAEAGLMVGGAFLSASLQVLFDRLASREVLNVFSKRKTNVDGLLKKLKRKLLLLNKVLDDADVKQFTDRNVRAWSDEARDAVYQADDLLSEIAYEARRRQVESDPEYQSLMDQVNTLISSSYYTSFDDYIEPKLGEILQLLEDLIEDAASLGLKEGVWRGVNRFSSSVPVATDVYLREPEKENLIQRLLQVDETNKNVGVIPVVGMGGMGKTTLAQFAYHDKKVDEHFDLKAWVCVSEVFDVPSVSKTILDSITGSSCNFTDLSQVQESLKGKVAGKKILLVLDDVWNVKYSEWDMLRAPFRTGAPGSKIIVTTRIQDAADIMRTGGQVINLEELSDKDCWPLFAEIAFGESNPCSHPQLEKIGRKIVRRCRGLPLAVKSLAGLLRSKPLDVGEWEDVLKSEIWDLTGDACDILPALRLSYHHLPSHLKQCFAICSIFPKDYPFREEKMVSLWIAQKFVVPRNVTSYEQEGKKCFRELLSMSFFQKYSYSESLFVMHDLIHDLAQAVSGQFAFKLDGKHQHDIPYKLRHCSYDLHSFRQLHAATEVTSLRTLLRDPSVGFDVEVLFRQKHLRVLSLPRYDDLADLELIGSLIHLQYLDLSRTKDMQQLPESICRLYNLETLLLVGCSSLTNLPVEMGKLISLRRLDITETNLKEMPIQMRLLKRLEYLSTFVVGKESGLAIDGLKAWNSLRGELEISGLENVKHKKDALEAKLVEKQHLETLSLEWGGVTNDSQQEIVLDCLRPHRNLKVLRIRNYGGTRFPDWLGDRAFTQMVSLRLEDCSYCPSLPPLGQLACLKELSVKGMRRVTDVGEDFLGGVNQPFPSLEALRFEDMIEWATWSLPGTGEFPKLRKLEMVNCPMLVGTLPEVNIATLVIEGCSSLEASVPSSSQRVELNWVAMSDLVKVEISGLPSLQVLTSELSALTKLKTLKVARCRNLLSLSNSGLPPMLTRLDIERCEVLQSVVDGMVSHNTCSLEWLGIWNCPLLASFADNGLPTTLKQILFAWCPKLELSLSEGIEMCSSVWRLTLYGCLSLNPLMLVKLFPNIQYLQTDDDLSISNVGGCPQGGGRLANLTRLSIRGYKNLKALSEGMCDSLLSKLRRLEIWHCKKLTSFESDWGLHRLPSLRELVIRCVINENVESFPNEGLLPSTLTSLGIGEFRNLKKLNWRGIRQLTSLEHLWIQHCPQLESLPDEGLPPSLLTLEIIKCPLLTARCKKDSGDDWPKIAHIPRITLDGVLICSALHET